MRYRFLLRPGWIAAILAVLLLTTAFVALGVWQFDRAHRSHRLSAAELAERSTPAPLAQLLSGGGLKDSKTPGRAVVISGTFDGSAQFLVPDRKLDGRVGSYVVAAMKLADGTAVVVNRGWTAGATAPPVPGGPVTVTGWIAAPEPSDGASRAAHDAADADPAHKIAAVDIAVLVNKWPYQLDQAYVTELSATPADGGGLATVPAPAPPSGKTNWSILNLGYWLQWWVFGVVGLWWFGAYVRRVADPGDDEDDEDDHYDEDDVELEGRLGDGGDAAGGVGGSGGRGENGGGGENGGDAGRGSTRADVVA